MAQGDFVHAWRINETASYLLERGFTVVTLQLPDELLGNATQLAGLLQAECQARGLAVQLYVLADTSYNSLSVDEVAAAHVGAQCVVHYGRASMTKLSRLPAYFVFPEGGLDVEAAAAAVAGSATVASSAHAVVFLDQPQLHLLPQLQAALGARLTAAGAPVQLTFAVVPVQHLEPQRPAGPAAAAAAGPVAAGQGGGCCRAESDAALGPAAVSGAAGPASCCEAAQPSCCGGAAAAAAEPLSQGEAEPSSSLAAVAAAPNGDAADEPAAAAAAAEGDAEAGESLAGYSWRLPGGTATSDACLVWVGAEDAPALLQLQMTHNASHWAVFDPQQGALQEGLPLAISRALRRRYYLVQKARDANIVGILVGTLGVAGYRSAIERVRSAAQRVGKKTYTLLVGKPSPAKLANFPEVEVFVLISDPQGQILDSKDFLAPIITPHEAMLAFSEEGEVEWDVRRYRLDFDGVAGAGEEAGAPGGSSGAAAADASGGEGGQSAAGLALALAAKEALQITAAPAGRSDLVQARSAADYYVHKRTYLGLETPLVGAEEKEVTKAVPGLSGRAAGYRDEPGRGGSSSDKAQ